MASSVRRSAVTTAPTLFQPFANHLSVPGSIQGIGLLAVKIGFVGSRLQSGFQMTVESFHVITLVVSVSVYSYLFILLVEIELHSERSVPLVYLLQIPAQLVP